MIQRINNNYNVSNNYSKVKEVNCSDSKKGDEKVSEVILDKDTFEKSIPEEKITYTKQEVEQKAKTVDKRDTEEVQRLIEENERKQEEFKQLIRSLIAD